MIVCADWSAEHVSAPVAKDLLGPRAELDDFRGVIDCNKRVGHGVHDPGLQHLAGGMRLRELAILVLQFTLLRAQLDKGFDQRFIRRFPKGLLTLEILCQLFVAPKHFLQFGTSEAPARRQVCCPDEV